MTPKPLKPKYKRAIFVGVLMAVLAVAAGLTLKALEDNLLYFYYPSQVPEGLAEGTSIKLGGLVAKDSVRQLEGPSGAVKVQFVVEDDTASLPVEYGGLLPDLFREGQGVIVEGELKNQKLVATRVLAKHDENYMPPGSEEAIQRLQRDGQIDAQETGQKTGQETGQEKGVPAYAQ